MLDRDQILIASNHNPRTEIGEAELAELTASIRTRGLLQPLRVRPWGDKYYLVAGERRLTAIDALGAAFTEQIPVVLTEMSDEHELKIDAIVENVQRVDLNPVEEALAYKGLIVAGWTPKGVAEQVGVSQARVTKRLEVLLLPEYCVDALRKGYLPISAVKSLRKLAAVSSELAIRAATRCSRKDQWGATLAKEPDQIVALLAQDPKECFWSANSVWNPEDLTATLGKAEPVTELVKRMRGWGSESYEQTLRTRTEHFADSITRHYVFGDEGRSPVITDEDDLLAGLLKAAAEHEQDLAARRKSAIEAKLRSGSIKPDQTVAEAEAEAKARAEERAKELAQRTESRAYNLQVGTLIKTELASLELTREVALAISSVMLDHHDIGRVGKAGLRYVFEELQKETRKKSKSTGVETVKIDYLPNYGECKKAISTWVAGASTPQEIIGRTLSVFIAAQLADNRVVALSSQQGEARVGHRVAMLHIAKQNAPEALANVFQSAIGDEIKRQEAKAAAILASAKNREASEDALGEALEQDGEEYALREQESNFPEQENADE